jgi:hypothetical protein
MWASEASDKNASSSAKMDHPKRAYSMSTPTAVGRSSLFDRDASAQASIQAYA